MWTGIAILVAVLVGVVLAGYAYHRWGAKASAVTETVAEKVNEVIDSTKK